jgi:hypothetical protein
MLSLAKKIIRMISYIQLIKNKKIKLSYLLEPSSALPENLSSTTTSKVNQVVNHSIQINLTQVVQKLKNSTLPILLILVHQEPIITIIQLSTRNAMSSKVVLIRLLENQMML